MFSRDRKTRLTGESISRLFKSNFDLASYAIALAKLRVQKEEALSVDALLEEIRKNPHPYSNEPN